MELTKIKTKGTDVGKCLTDGINKSFSQMEEMFRYMYQIVLQMLYFEVPTSISIC